VVFWCARYLLFQFCQRLHSDSLWTEFEKSRHRRRIRSDHRTDADGLRCCDSRRKFQSDPIRRSCALVNRATCRVSES
jgi:hypothetical protein